MLTNQIATVRCAVIRSNHADAGMARFSFPLEEFPVYRPHGDVGAGMRRGEEQQFNSVQYGRLSAMLEGGEGALAFRQQGMYA